MITVRTLIHRSQHRLSTADLIVDRDEFIRHSLTVMASLVNRCGWARARQIVQELPAEVLQDFSTTPGREPGLPLGCQPKGLWFTFGVDDYTDFLQGLPRFTRPDSTRSFPARGSATTLPYAHEVRLVPGTRMLTIATAAELAGFTAAFGIPGNYPCSSTAQQWTGKKSMPIAIDWTAVAQSYSGVSILVSPGDSQVRNQPRLRWFVPWGHPSGVIWDATVINELIPIADGAT